MRIITRKRLREFAERHPDAAEPPQQWYRVFREAEWKSLQEVRRVYPHADAVTVGSGNTVTVFNIRGNKYRLVVAIHYNRERVYILRLLTHAEYSKGFWKGTL
jgi:mRNA interferase HigB